MRYLIHFLRCLRFFLLYPIYSFKWLSEDIKKDLNSKHFKSNAYYVWCPGLPKSGTTLLEEIFDCLPYVRLNHSMIRIWHNKNIKSIHDVNENTFKGMSKFKYTSLKTHSHYLEEYDHIIKSFNLKVIISLRDLRDMMISRYFHIMNNKKHWLYSEIINLDFKEGFKKSLISVPFGEQQTALEYYYYWIYNWKKKSLNSNYLVLWYEEYFNDPLFYISKILEYLEFNEFSPNLINSKTKKKYSSNHNLELSLKKFGKLKSTYRKGNIQEWKAYFDDDITNFFHKNLPDNIENVTYQN